MPPETRHRRRLLERLEDAARDGHPAADEVAVGIGVAWRDLGDALAGPVQASVEAEGASAGQGQGGPRVHFEVFQPVLSQLKVRDDGRPVDHQMHGGAEVDLVAGPDFLGADGPADDGAAFQDEDLVAGFGEVTGADEPVVSRADDDGVVVGVSRQIRAF